MTDPLLPASDGHTALGEDERSGLIPSYIATRAELNDAEQRNIVKATVLRKPPTLEGILDDGVLRALHRAMFGDVWSWAGTYRLRDTNIGVAWEQIPMAVVSLVDDARVWIDLGSYEADEIGVRFHHRLTSIHPFPNGNGRHARVCADDLVIALGRPAFTWGADLSASASEVRASYIAALRSADAGTIDPLSRFARA